MGDAFDKILDSMGPFFGLLEGRVRLNMGEDEGKGEGPLSRLLRMNGLETRANVTGRIGLGGEIAAFRLLRNE
jgi:hypothetical protein